MAGVRVVLRCSVLKSPRSAFTAPTGARSGPPPTGPTCAGGRAAAGLAGPGGATAAGAFRTSLTGPAPSQGGGAAAAATLVGARLLAFAGGVVSAGAIAP